MGVRNLVTMVRTGQRQRAVPLTPAGRQPPTASRVADPCPDDNTIQLLTSRCLAPADQDRVWAHVAQCDKCCHLLAHLAGVAPNDTVEQVVDPCVPSLPLPVLPTLTRGATLGRYILTRALGAGGMGVVWEAYDPELARTVALKFLRETTENTSARIRLLREAQAMARLSHPNVITVHDVGTISGHPFIAMERVHGCALDKWLSQRTRLYPELLRVFMDAGHGLAAAHAAGLVHRDFKPQNVLVDETGRAKVTDFGLARVLHAPEVTIPDRPPGTLPEAQLQSDQTGWLVGTLQYMSPEQLEGHAATSLSDQFSYCVAFWEAVYGQRPFVGETQDALASAIKQGPPTARPPGSVPRAIHRALLQGLSTHPAQRHPSMDALLAALASRPWVHRGSRWLVASAVVLVAGSLPGYRYLLDKPEPCTGARAQMQEVWANGTAEAVGRAFLATGSPHAEHIFTGVRQRLDAHANAWVAMHTATCKATRVHGEQPESLLVARMDCLERRKQEVNALVDFLLHADTSVVENAIQAVESLQALDGCANSQALLAKVAAPLDPGVGQQVAEMRAKLTTARALNIAGRYQEALEWNKRLQPIVADLAFEPLEAEWLALQGSTLRKLNDLEGALVALKRAAVLSEKVRDDEAAAWVYDDLVACALRQARYELASVFADQLYASNSRLGFREDLQGVWEEAQAQLQYRWQSDLNGALAHAQKALEVMSRSLGPDHLRLANTRSLLGSILGALHKADQEVQQREAILAIHTKVLGASHPATAIGYNNLGWALVKAGRYDDAMVAHQRALDLRMKSFGQDNPATLWSEISVAESERQLGRYKDALARLERVLPLAENVMGPRHPRVGYTHLAVARVLSGLGQNKRAWHQVEAALAIIEDVDREHLDVAEYLLVAGDILQALQQPSRAMKAYERAASIFSAKQHSKELAAAQVGVVESMTALGMPSAQAPFTVTQARDALATANPVLKPYLQRAEQWLRLHGVSEAHPPSR